MRIFGFPRDTKTSANRRRSAAAVDDASVMNEAPAQGRVALASVQSAHVEPAVGEPARGEAEQGAPVTSTPDIVEGQLGAEEHGHSDVFVCRRSAPDLDGEAAQLAEEAAAAAAAAQGVTLFVYGWHNVEPGPLSWVFPSLRAALDAVRTMRNAVEWCIVSGSEWSSIDAARAKGAVLVEQST